MQQWQKRDDLELVLSIDRDCKGRQRDIGLVPTVLERMNLSPENAVAITCDPPVMIKSAFTSLE